MAGALRLSGAAAAWRGRFCIIMLAMSAVAGEAGAQARRVTGPVLNATWGTPYQWLPDGSGFMVSTPGSSIAYDLKVAFDGTNHLVVWRQEWRRDTPDIGAGRVSPSGQVLDRFFRSGSADSVGGISARNRSW